MFQFPGLAYLIRYVPYGTGSPIRISADLGIFAPPRSFSQLVTSFFASGSLGIPHAPFLTSLSGFLQSGVWVIASLGFVFARFEFPFQYVNDLVVENNGFEPLTPCLQSRCSSQLS